MEKKIKLVDTYLKLNNNCQNPLKQIWPGDIKNVSHLDEAQFMLKGTDRQVVFKGAYKEAPWEWNAPVNSPSSNGNFISPNEGNALAINIMNQLNQSCFVKIERTESYTINDKGQFVDALIKENNNGHTTKIPLETLPNNIEQFSVTWSKRSKHFLYQMVDGSGKKESNYDHVKKKIREVFKLNLEKQEPYLNTNMTRHDQSLKKEYYKLFLGEILENKRPEIFLSDDNFLPELYDQRNENAWLFACKNGKENSVQTLKDYFDINYKNQAGESGLFFACLNGDEKLVRSLLDVKAKADNKVLWAAKQNGNNKILNRIKKELEKNPYI